MAEMDDLVKEFLVESTENLDRLDQDFVALEKDSAARDRLGSIFRTIHTIKGTCGFLGFSKLESVTHVGESLLSKLRDGELTATSDIISGLLAMVDAVREILASIEGTATEGDGDHTKITENLSRLKDAALAAPAAAVAAPPKAEAAPLKAEAAPVETPAHEPIEAEAPAETEAHGEAEPNAGAEKPAVAAAAEPGKPLNTRRPILPTAASAWTWDCWTA